MIAPPTPPTTALHTDPTAFTAIYPHIGVKATVPEQIAEPKAYLAAIYLPSPRTLLTQLFFPPSTLVYFTSYPLERIV